MPAVRKPKEYLTGRVRQGLTDEFRQSIPEGFGFGVALEIILERWIALPAALRNKVLMGEVGIEDVVAAISLWNSLPPEYRERYRAGEAPDLHDLIEKIVDQKIALGRKVASEIAEPEQPPERPKRTPAAAGSRRHSSDTDG